MKKEKLKDEEIKDIIKFILSNFNIENKESMENLYSSLIDYIKNIRCDIESFKKNIISIIELFSMCGYNSEELVVMLTIEPSLLHEDKNNIFWKLLLFGKVYNPKTGNNLRCEDVINHPKIFRTSIALIYARIKYLESEEGKEYRRNKDYLTKRQITKITNQEFQDSYHITNEKLITLYPFDNLAQLEVISWSENKEFLDNIFGKDLTKKIRSN